MKFRENLARWSALFGVLFALAAPAQAQLAATQTWLGTAGGSSTALTFTVHNVAALTDLVGVPLRFLPSANGLGPTTVTITLDSGGMLGPTVLLRPTTNMGLQQLGSELVSGVLKEMVYDGTEFVLTSPIDMTPIGNAVEVRLSIAPTGTLIEDGTCYTRTTYPALFTQIGTTYNAAAPVACTGTQFAVPDSRGANFTAIDNQGSQGTAGRITAATCAAPTTINGAICGLEKKGIVFANIPQIALSVSTGGANLPATAGTWNNASTINNSGVSGQYPQGTAAVGNLSTLTGTAGNASPTAFATLPPVVLGVRAIKY